jgi:hypothetical protein
MTAPVVNAANAKYGFAAVIEGEPMVFAPFDSHGSAAAVRASMTSFGYEVGPVQPVYTVGTAQAILSARRRGIPLGTVLAQQPVAAQEQRREMVARVEPPPTPALESGRRLPVVAEPERKSVWRRLTEL